MKKIMFFLLLLLFTTQLHASLRQTKYRWRNDDGPEGTATWIAPENTAIMVLNTTPSIRLRIEFDNNNTLVQLSPVNDTLQYSSDGGTTWTSVTNAATDAFVYTTSIHVANGLATTSQMTAGTAGVFVAGRVVTSPAPALTLLGDGERTEYEWVIRPTANAVPGTTYTFQTLGQEDAPLVYPTLTITPVCAGTPLAGTVEASASFIDCNTTTELRLSGNTIGLGISHQWQWNQGGAWTNFGADNDTVTTPPVVQSAWFRCIVTCNVGGIDTTDSVEIRTAPLPVNLGNDLNQCVDSGMAATLDAGAHAAGSVFLWDDGTTAQTRPVFQNGSYSVQVTEPSGCTGRDTIAVTLRKNPVVDLGNDTSVCNGAKLVLDAGTDGIAYFWSNGESTQTIEINNAGSYIAFVTNDEGCVKSDTILVAMDGELPSIQGINVNNDGQYTFQYTPVNPQNVLSYLWDFGDGSPQSTLQNPTHTFPGSGNYIVILEMRSSCGKLTDSTSASIVGINQIKAGIEELTIFPNPMRAGATILNRGDLKMERIEVYNLIGQIIYTAAADSKEQHKLVLTAAATGIYTVKIYTDRGVVLRKIEVLE